MKKIFFALVGVLGLTSAHAQCTPDPQFAGEDFGVWPDTIADFAPGIVGQFYSDTLNLMVPALASSIPSTPPYPPFPIDSIQLVSVEGLPPGLSVDCNSQTAGPCTYLPTILGCGLIEGTPTTVGTYPVVLNVLAWFTLIGPTSEAASFDGYEIVITSNTGIASIAPMGLGSVRNVPNPFASRTTIEFQVGRTGDATVRVFNMVGEELWTQRVQAKAGANKVVFEGGELPAGVYLYKVESGSETYTGRMALQR
ncbi:MAG: T9SS type A sorting domain-containing protein [Flavobacteriales bacterium]|nr:T9SS type A sorting domain-containing protein [Flavobacteriales bacterium]